jgi:uncharacterized protein (DUF362 family)
VVKILVRGAEGEPREIPRDRLRAALDAGIAALLDLSSPRDAWRELFSREDYVSLKANCLAGPMMSTLPAVCEAVVAALERGGVSPSHCTIWDRTERELRQAGYRIRKSGAGPKVMATDSPGVGFTSELHYHGRACSLISRILTNYSTCWINVPRLKDHNLAGMSGGLKNAFGAVHNPNKYHSNNCDPYVADVNAIPVIKERHRLTVVDALAVQVHGGPAYRREWAAAPRLLLLGVDPVAVDVICLEILSALRKQQGLPPLEQEERPAVHLRTAARSDYGLGIGDRARIKLQEIEI